MTPTETSMEKAREIITKAVTGSLEELIAEALDDSVTRCLGCENYKLQCECDAEDLEDLEKELAYLRALLEKP
jgi:hypothetical protein